MNHQQAKILKKSSIECLKKPSLLADVLGAITLVGTLVMICALSLLMNSGVEL